MKKKVIKSVLLATLFTLGGGYSKAAAYSHTNLSSDRELWTVSYASSGVLVPFAITGIIDMQIRVDYPGKIVGYEEIYAALPNANRLPFVSKLTANTIKYYKDGAYLSTHYLSTIVAHYNNPADKTSDLSNSPGSNFADANVYKAIGYGRYESISTIPSARTFDTTEGVVD